MWRQAVNTTYNKIGEVQLKSDNQVIEFRDNVLIATIILTGNNTIEVQSGDVVGYYQPLQSRYRVRTMRTNGYILYQFSGSHKSVDLNNNILNTDQRQPLIQFTIGKLITYDILCA